MKYFASFELTAQNCLNNRAINYGDGVFETLLVECKKIPLWNLHMQRLNASLKKLNINPLDENSLLKTALSLVDDEKSYVLKLVVFRDDQKRGYASDSTSSQFYMSLNPYNEVKVSSELTRSSQRLSKQKKLAGLKHLNRLEQVLAAQELSQSNYTDAIMCDSSGHVIETTSKNIILFKQDKIYSPKLNKSGVYGVALRWLLSQGHKINWKKIEFNDLPQYHGMMVCNSIQGFSFINKIDNKIHFKKQSNLAELIQTQWVNRC